jgi:uncharacterized protein (DUF58 family)
MQFSKWVTLVFGALCLVAVAGAVNAQHLYYMAAILLTLPGISYLLGWFALRGLEFRRELPPMAWQGEEGEFVYQARNTTHVSRYFLSVQEKLPGWITTVEEEPPLFNVAANDSTRVATAVRYARRGVYQVESFDASAMDPLGVFAFTKHVACDGELVVYPMPEPMRSVGLSGAGRYGWQEMTTALMRGYGVDPDGVREYAPGDPLRRIHWRQTARTGKLNVIEFEEPESISIAIILDLQRGTDVGEEADSTLEYAVRLAASVAYQAVQQGASVQLIAPTGWSQSETTESILRAAALSGRGQTHLFTILDALARVEAQAAETISELTESALQSIAPGTTALVVTSRPAVGLPDALCQHTLTGANAVVVYIDPNTFPKGARLAAREEAAPFLAALVASHVQPFLLRCQPEGELIPEAIHDAHILTAESAARN